MNVETQRREQNRAWAERRAAHREAQSRRAASWKPFEYERAVVRCIDGVHRPTRDVVRLDDGRYVPKHTAQQSAGMSLTG